MSTATIHASLPSDYLDDDGTLYYVITIYVGCDTIGGQVTLSPSKYDGKLAPKGAMEHWVSGSLRKFALELTEDSRRVLREALVAECVSDSCGTRVELSFAGIPDSHPVLSTAVEIAAFITSPTHLHEGLSSLSSDAARVRHLHRELVRAGAVVSDDAARYYVARMMAIHELVEDGGAVSWRGPLWELFYDNGDALDAVEILGTLTATGRHEFGGGAAPRVTLAAAESGLLLNHWNRRLHAASVVRRIKHAARAPL